ncbi:SpaH/EbpB family LPXTG-anchored major pilin [Corynebacterium minutissimum]|uniref:Surface-anchored fimbrial subunit n=1 Tax=Corynebacterium minutissimum TaxID=38301 RepID=A0A376D1X7_9CORY|nr:SpaH/EbpB family LPXTG-anchored major pilin [Corynebacterium minutissimum]QRP61569.1 SpaH/EbpB family LPXTG-anchored major pilin [Corynebacterium minutissimum]STC80318.1 surface-anchored fimbrial subunit [Corynebacterium minutissimum]
MNKVSSRLAAIVAAGTISIAGAGFAAPALAQTEAPTSASAAAESGIETPPGPAEIRDASLIDANQPVKLTITKFLGDPGDTSTPLPDTEFKVERVDVDLTTQEGWKQLSGFTAEDAPIDSGFAALTKKTDASGIVTFDTASDGLKVGAYKVTEVSRNGYTTAPPFLITLPHDVDGKWSYEQEVQPKNQNLVPSKQVKDVDATIGKQLTYTVNAPVPADKLSRFIIQDPLNAALSVNTVDVKVSLAGATNGATLAAGDYNITLDSATNTLQVEFTKEGLAKLQEARKAAPGLKVLVEFPATITKAPEGGEITNTAKILLPNGAEVDTNGDDPATPDVEDNPTKTTFGTLTITKTSSNAKEGDSLDGAEFELYQCKQENGKWQLLGSALNMATAADGTPATTIKTAGSEGTVPNLSAKAMGYTIPIQSFAAVTGVNSKDYCVLETKAPNNFVRNEVPQHVTVDVNAKTLAVEVDNQRNSVLGQLPATGAWGIILVFLVGLALLARGIYTSYKDSRTA